MGAWQSSRSPQSLTNISAGEGAKLLKEMPWQRGQAAAKAATLGWTLFGRRLARPHGHLCPPNFRAPHPDV